MSPAAVRRCSGQAASRAGLGPLGWPDLSGPAGAMLWPPKTSPDGGTDVHQHLPSGSTLDPSVSTASTGRNQRSGPEGEAAIDPPDARPPLCAHPGRSGEEV